MSGEDKTVESQVAATSTESEIPAGESHETESSDSNVDSGSEYIGDSDESNGDGVIAEKAKKMGHVPKEKFKGDPEKWVDAKTFVERGETVIPIMRKEIVKQTAQIDELKRTIKELSEYTNKAEQRAFEKAFREIKAEQLEAVANGDREGFLDTEKRIEDLYSEASSRIPPTLKEIPEEKEPDKEVFEENQPYKPSYEFTTWNEKNPWYGTSKEMSIYADAMGDFIRKTNPNMPEEKFLEEVSIKVRKEFPNKFKNQNRESAQSVESSQPSSKKGGKTFADLPKEARDAFERWQRNGVKVDKETYVKQYFEG